LGSPLLFTEEFELVIMIAVVTDEMHGSDRVSYESEMALFSECMQ
jgi:hypothetical protein